MKNGAYYGAILSRLNRGIVYLNLKTIIDELDLDRGDMGNVVDSLCSAGLARKINECEYELICDIGQLRDFVLEKQNESVSPTVKGEYSVDANKPISLEDIAGESWHVKEQEKKEEDSFLNRMKRRRQERDRLRSIFDDDDEEESKEEICEEFKSLILSMTSYDEKTDTFEPGMRITFPDGVDRLVLGYGVDSDMDFFLTDKDSLYNYLMKRMPSPEDECTQNLIDQLLVKLARATTFMKEEKSIVNFLTGSRGLDYLRKEINYYITEYGTFLNSIAWLSELAPITSSDYKAELEEKIKAFLDEKANHVDEFAAKIVSEGSGTRGVINQIVEIDSRISKEEAYDVAMHLKSRMSEAKCDEKAIGHIDAATSMLRAYSCSAFNAVKIDYYTNKRR